MHSVAGIFPAIPAHTCFLHESGVSRWHATVCPPVAQMHIASRHASRVEQFANMRKPPLFTVPLNTKTDVFAGGGPRP